MEWPTTEYRSYASCLTLNSVIFYILEISCFHFCLRLSISLITSFIHACLNPQNMPGIDCLYNECILSECVLHFTCFLCWFYLFKGEHGMMSWVFVQLMVWLRGSFFFCVRCLYMYSFLVRVCFCLLIDILLSYSRSSDLTFYMLITIWYRFTHFPNISYILYIRLVRSTIIQWLGCL